MVQFEPKMSKLVGLSGMRSLDQFRSSLGSPASSGAAKSFQISSRKPSYSNSSGSFANLKLAAEKLIKEQASSKTDLDLAIIHTACKTVTTAEDHKTVTTAGYY